MPHTTASPCIELRPVTRDNFDAITDLELLDHQEDYLASNAYSIAQASFYPNYQTRAIYADGALVGFLMYVCPDGVEQPAGDYGIWRFMVDARQQGKGLGRLALQALLQEIAAYSDARRVVISYVPDNRPAQQFYASFGFVEIGIEDGEDGEMVAVLSLQRDSSPT